MGKSRKILAVILAAGKSKRMKSDFSKVVHKILGKEIINYLIDSLILAGIKEDDIVIVAGDNLNEIRSAVKRDVNFVVQKEQLGTADALLSAEKFIRDLRGDLLVTVGDNPYVNRKELTNFISFYREKNHECIFLSAVFPSTPPPYGRVIRNKNGSVEKVVEELDATKDQLNIREVNSSIYLFNSEIVYPLLKKIGNDNVKKEYYLTDIISILNREGFSVDALPAENYRISIGINNRWELAEAEKEFNLNNMKLLAIEKGVTILQPESVTIEMDVEIGKDTVIYPNVYISSGTKIGRNCRIGPFAYLNNIKLGDNESVSFEKRVDIKNFEH